MPPNPPSNSRLPRLAVWSGYGTGCVPTTPDFKTFFLSFVRIKFSSVSVVFVLRVGSLIRQSRLKIFNRCSRARPSLCCLSEQEGPRLSPLLGKPCLVSEESASSQSREVSRCQKRGFVTLRFFSLMSISLWREKYRLVMPRTSFEVSLCHRSKKLRKRDQKNKTRSPMHYPLTT